MMNYLTLSNLWKLFVLLIDIGFVAVLIYYCLKIVRNNSKTVQIFKGILFFFLLNGLAQLAGLKTIEYFTNQVLSWGFLAIIIIFQPEIRSLLEKLGKTTVFSTLSSLSDNEKEHLVKELVKTSAALSKTKTGAIISIEQGQSLSDFISTGTKMNSVVSSELLCSIFQYGTPLHDGAVIIQGDKIACASAYFPPTTRDFPSSYGARHRAAVGISEINDCVTIVVSEESGNISIAKDGHLDVLTPVQLKDYLLKTICQSDAKTAGTSESEVKQETSSKRKINFKGKNKKRKYEKRKVTASETKNPHDEKIEVQEIVAAKVIPEDKVVKGSDDDGKKI